MSDFRTRLGSFDHFMSDLGSHQTYLKQDVKRLRLRIASLEDQKVLAVKAQGVLDRVCQTVASKGIGRIERVTTKGLRTVFGPNISLVIEGTEGVKGTTYKLQIKDGDVLGDPMETFGGGVVNVTSLLLRVILIKKFGLAKFIALDESMNNVSKEYTPRVSELLRVLAKDHNYKILAITHQPILAEAADKIYRVSKVKGQSTMVLVDRETLEKDDASTH